MTKTLVAANLFGVAQVDSAVKRARDQRREVGYVANLGDPITVQTGQLTNQCECST